MNDINELLNRIRDAVDDETAGRRAFEHYDDGSSDFIAWTEEEPEVKLLWHKAGAAVRDYVLRLVEIELAAAKPVKTTDVSAPVVPLRADEVFDLTKPIVVQPVVIDRETSEVLPDVKPNPADYGIAKCPRCHGKQGRSNCPHCEGRGYTGPAANVATYRRDRAAVQGGG